MILLLMVGGLVSLLRRDLSVHGYFVVRALLVYSLCMSLHRREESGVVLIGGGILLFVNGDLTFSFV